MLNDKTALSTIVCFIDLTQNIKLSCYFRLYGHYMYNEINVSAQNENNSCQYRVRTHVLKIKRLVAINKGVWILIKP